jgi:hypothetical protein
MLVLSLIVALTLSFVSIWRYGKVLNPFTLEAYITILFLIVPQLLLLIVDPTAEAYLYSDLVIIVYLVAAFLGTMVNFKAITLKGLSSPDTVNALNVVLYFLLAIPLFFYFLQFEISFAGIRTFYETVVFSPYASLFELSKYLLYFIIVIRLFKVNKFDLITIVLSTMLLFYGSKYAVFDLIIILFVYFEQFRRLPMRKLFIMGFVAAALLVSYRYYQSKMDQDVFTTALSYFDLYKNQSLLIRKIMEEKFDFYYGRIYFSSYLKYIPRAIWSDKPFAFGSAILNYDLFPENARNGYMPAFGLGPLFADFGFVSVFVFAFFSGMLRNYLYRIFLNSQNSFSFILYAFPQNFVTVFFLLTQVLFDFIIRMSQGRIEPIVSERE